MKLRLRDDTLRLRLTRSEIGQLIDEGSVFGETRFGPNTHEVLRFGLRAIRETSGLTVTYVVSTIEVGLPADRIQEWQKTDRVGFEETVDIGDGQVLKVLVEKDFKCLTSKSRSDDADTFPHPREGKESC